jgi:hypothetical protein
MLKTADHPEGVDRAGFEATFAAWRRDYPDWLVRGPSNVELF